LTFRADFTNIQTRMGKASEENFLINANEEEVFIIENEIFAKHADFLRWFKSDIGIGQVQAKMVILYLSLSTIDPKVSAKMCDWA